MVKSIMFLSIMDFMDKGIQVVRLTPEYLANNGWNVHYVVTRDNSEDGSYHYQDVVNPTGVIVHRSSIPSCWVGGRLKNHILKTIYSKLRGYAAILKLAMLGCRVLKNNNIDVIYGGGPHGILAANLVKLLHPHRTLVTVSRYYGVWDLYSETIKKKKWLKLLLNVDIFLSLYLRSDLKIITNDGTQGDKALACIRNSNIQSLLFYVNGINNDVVDLAEIDALRESLITNNDFSAVCITRLVSLKRVNMCIAVTAAVVKKLKVSNFKLIIVGDGPERGKLQQLAEELGVTNHVIFVGAVDNQKVKNFLAFPDVFLSTYDVSNVGNPLLEAIRANKVIFTINNGDTSSWIKHYENGFIYDDDEFVIDKMAHDIVTLIHTPSLRDKIKTNIQITERKKLWTWDERLNAEFTEIDKLVQLRDRE